VENLWFLFERNNDETMMKHVFFFISVKNGGLNQTQWGINQPELTNGNGTSVM